MEHLLSCRQPLTPIVFDYAKFLISSGKFADAKAYGAIVSRLGFKADSFSAEMKKFATSASTFKGSFVIDKVSYLIAFNFLNFYRLLKML